MAQPGKAQPAAQPPFVAFGGFAVEQQGEPFGVRQRGAGRVGLQLGEGARHADEAELMQLFDGRMRQQFHSP
jgi:hypothetical protein